MSSALAKKMESAEAQVEALVGVLLTLKKQWWVTDVLCDCVRAEQHAFTYQPEIYAKMIGQIVEECFGESTGDFCKALEEHLKEHPLQSGRARDHFYGAVMDDIMVCVEQMTPKDINDVKIDLLMGHVVYFGASIICAFHGAGRMKQAIRKLGENFQGTYGDRLEHDLTKPSNKGQMEIARAFFEGLNKRDDPIVVRRNHKAWLELQKSQQ